MFMRMVGREGVVVTSLVRRQLDGLVRHLVDDVWFGKQLLAAQARIAARFFATAPPKDFRGHSLRSLVWRKSPQGAHTAAAYLVGW